MLLEGTQDRGESAAQPRGPRPTTSLKPLNSFSTVTFMLIQKLISIFPTVYTPQFYSSVGKRGTSLTMG